ncbi:hypothetical protein F511_05559 [Dorcoceras hygrometricum]|uniref:PIN domain-containing protein n=1 Tax=Dorcoceras hygrometricum TaxID=472368 RepID=A0A2Z7AR83_9LAMI|nr:hypothetical protein F511_05559 [Dorcoceras hygrometricum]
MEVEKATMENRPKTFDEVSMERSKSFVTALQELKNLRPQLHSAAEYCEKSYLHSEQKQMVLDNLKDYAVRALVNAIDHLGTVAYKLSDVLEQQTLEISSMDLKVTCLNQQLLTCQTYTDEEGLRQQQLLAVIPRHHKHYILPNSVSKKVHFSPQIQTDPRQPVQARARLYPSGASAATTLSWHLASETKSTLKCSPRGIVSTEDSKVSGKTSNAFNLSDTDDKTWMKSMSASTVAMQTLGVTRRESLEGSKPIAQFRSFDIPAQRENVRPRAPGRSKSVLSSFFAKPKTQQNSIVIWTPFCGTTDVPFFLITVKMGKAKKTPKFAVMKKIISHKAVKHHKEEVLNPKKKDLNKEKLPRNVPQVSSALFFKHNTALGPPYRVLVDTNFINFSIQNKLDLEKGMMDCLYAKCTPCITDCVMAELEKIAKDPRFERLPCIHKGTYADDCLVDRVTQHKCYIVATCDRDLKRRIRKIPGVPIMYITKHKYSIERLPEATIGGGTIEH